MGGFALVRFEDVVVMMPFQRPCEKELAFESAAFYAQRYGEIRLEVEQREMRVRRRDRGRRRRSAPCARCGRAARLAFVIGRDSFCLRCARDLASAPRADEDLPALLA
jgi:hypothetical protein